MTKATISKAKNQLIARALKFCNASTIVPLLIDYPAITTVVCTWRDAPSPVVWWMTPVECASALGRLLRDRARTCQR